jgi:hypothetical protein
LLAVVAAQVHLAAFGLSPIAARSPVFLAAAFGCDFLLHSVHPGSGIDSTPASRPPSPA